MFDQSYSPEKEAEMERMWETAKERGYDLWTIARMLEPDVNQPYLEDGPFWDEMWDWERARDSGSYLDSVSKYEDVLRLMKEGERNIESFKSLYNAMFGFSYRCPSVIEFKHRDSKRKIYKYYRCNSYHCHLCNGLKGDLHERIRLVRSELSNVSIEESFHSLRFIDCLKWFNDKWRAYYKTFTDLKEEPTPEECPADYRRTEVFTLEEFRRFRDDVEKDPYTHIDPELIMELSLNSLCAQE